MSDSQNMAQIEGVKVQVGPNNKTQESELQQEGSLELYTSSPTLRSSLSGSLLLSQTGATDTSPLPSPTQSSEQRQRLTGSKNANTITFEDLVNGRTKFKWGSIKAEENGVERVQQWTSDQLPAQTTEKKEDEHSVSSIRRRWETGNKNEQKAKEEDQAKPETPVKKEDDFRSIMNRFKHLEMKKSNNLIFDESEEENTPVNRPVTKVAGKASMFEKISLQSKEESKKLKQKNKKQQQVERCNSDPASVKGRAAMFENQNN